MSGDKEVIYLIQLFIPINGDTTIVGYMKDESKAKMWIETKHKEYFIKNKDIKAFKGMSDQEIKDFLLNRHGRYEIKVIDPIKNNDLRNNYISNGIYRFMWTG